jgi:hypothetical protein
VWGMAMRGIIGGLVFAATVVMVTESARAKDLPEADCGRFAMALEYSPLFVANGLLCHRSAEQLGQAEIIEAHGRSNFTFLRHLTADETAGILPDDLEYFADRIGFFRTTEKWGEAVRRGEFDSRAFGGVSLDRSVKGFECVAFSRYSGTGAAPDSFRHEFIGLFCFESSKGPVPMDGALIDDFLKRLRLKF